MSSREATAIKRPSYQFYPGDWLQDSALRTCSLAAKGLWIDMNCLMHQGHPYGHLTLRKDGAEDTLCPIFPVALARIVGSNEEEVSRLLQELENAGVFSRNADNVIFSRRMVRDEKLREVRGSGGHKSLQNPNVPRSKDRSKDTFGRSLPVSFGGSPSSSSSSSEITGNSSTKPPVPQQAFRHRSHATNMTDIRIRNRRNLL